MFERLADDGGFSLVELLVSLLIVVTLTSAVLLLVDSGTTLARTQPDVVDLQQRGRVGADLLSRDLYMAGAGVYLPPATGPLRRFFAPVVPRRMGLQNADPPGTARTDAITIFYVPATRGQTTLRDALPAGGTDLRVDYRPHCPANDLLCGLGAGTSIVVFDDIGHFDFFTVTQALLDVGRLRSWQSGHASFGYAAGSAVSEAEWHTYYFDAQNRQLRHFDGYLTDIPVVDDVVGVGFEYYGDPQPPQAPRPAVGTANCLYDAAGAPVGGLAVLASQGGPWPSCRLRFFPTGRGVATAITFLTRTCCGFAKSA